MLSHRDVAMAGRPEPRRSVVPGGLLGVRWPDVRRVIVWVVMMASVPASAHGGPRDPGRTPTLYVHGFELTGADRHGTFGEDVDEPIADSIAALGGLPTAHDPGGWLPGDVVTGTTYYGDRAPAYYTAADLSELDRITAEWGGGVPRYAFIVARHAREAMARSGATQINLVSASFGSLVVRWLIEKDVLGLASGHCIARWLTIEGVLGGNWAASHPDLEHLLDLVSPDPIDVEHMAYGWVESNLHMPRTEADSPAYGDILVGEVASTDDSHNQAALRNAMLLANDYHPNDSVQALADACFAAMSAPARLAGRLPTLAVFHNDHLGIRDVRAAWAEAITFLTSSRRVTVTMSSAQVKNLHEPEYPFWNWAPAEVLFESRVFSPAAEARWAVTGPLCARVKEGAAAPLRRFYRAGDTEQVDVDLFDDFVLPEETQLRLELHADELDYDPRYGVYETAQTPYYDDMDGGELTVSTRASGTYAFAVDDWNCTVTVSVQDYPFGASVDVPGDPAPASGAPGRLAITPSPSPGPVAIRLPLAAGMTGEEPATLEITDISGHSVRRMSGALRAGFAWDGRDESGRPVAAGIYLCRARSELGSWVGRVCVVR